MMTMTLHTQQARSKVSTGPLIVLANTAQEPLTSVGAMREWIANVGQGNYLLVAHGGGQVFGGLMLKTQSSMVRRHAGEICRVAVDQERSGWGIGSRLVAAAVDLADNWLNLYRLELLVRADNPAAINLYRKFGFVEEGLLRGLGYRNGEYMDCLAMARLRGPLGQRIENRK
jgi:L-phenylalanine/L-methionine N-acetyltransferase